MNPLLDFSGLPRFAEIKPEHVAPAIEKLLAENRVLIARLLADTASPTWQNFVVPMEDAHERLSRAWGPVGHLNSVMNSPELREAYNTTLPVLTQYYAELGQNIDLFNKFKMLRNSDEFSCLSATRKQIIENELRDFRLGGAELPEGQKKRYLEIQERLIYTTNAIESLNMSLKKIIKNRGSFPSDEAMLKLFYLAQQNISKKWTMPIRDWKAALNRFTIQFGDRMPQH